MPNKEEIIQFSTIIERIVSSTGMSYMDAVISHCKESNLELEVASKLLSQSVVAKIEQEALGLNLLKEKVARLPF